jgi:hypothetical protein
MRCEAQREIFSSLKGFLTEASVASAGLDDRLPASDKSEIM